MFDTYILNVEAVVLRVSKTGIHALYCEVFVAFVGEPNQKLD